MHFKEFDYDVFMMVEISGLELLFLQELSANHYDGTCKAAGKLGGFLYGFIQQWKTMSNDPAEWKAVWPKSQNLDRTDTIKMTGHEIGIWCKICECQPSHSKRLLESTDFVRLLNSRRNEYNRIIGKEVR